MKQTELKIEGMSCGHCVATIKDALEALPGVESAQVSLDEGKAVVVHAAGDAALIAAVEAEGYRAKVG